MRLLRKLLNWMAWTLRPISRNATFFAFMYVLGVACAWLTLRSGRGVHVYENLYLELFLDLYMLCLVLLAIPHKVRRWVRVVLSVVLYAVAIVDVYCFTKFDSTLTPTMLLLVDETDAREAGEFLRSYLSPDVIFSRVGWVLLIALLHLLVSLRHCFPRLTDKLRGWVEGLRNRWPAQTSLYVKGFGGMAVAVLLAWSAVSSAHNKAATWRLMSGRTIGEVEHTLTESHHAVLYEPIYRLVFSVYANSLTAQQITKLIQAADKVHVDSCSYRSPTIVLVIGESYAKHHSQQYGYALPTTPRQLARERSGLLVRFDDVVAPWNLTSFVFKNMFSMHVVGQRGEWCDYPLFPELFRAAGYQVTFLTNQFLPKAREAVYDFSGGFFLNNPTLSAAQFDLRNTATHPFDEGLLKDYDQLVEHGKIKTDGQPNLIIFHLIGQHVNYRTRSPKDRRRFHASDYERLRPDLTPRQRRILADYDNATLYNDSIVDQICHRFDDKDAIVIYVPDHGEECYEPGRGFICRNHSARVDWPLAHYEFEIPFWIWCSPRYAHAHPDVFQAVVQARGRRFMTDALPHMLLYLAGIAAPDYHEAYNLLSPQYDETRPRILKNSVDYDSLTPPKH